VTQREAEDWVTAQGGYGYRYIAERLLELLSVERIHERVACIDIVRSFGPDGGARLSPWLGEDIEAWRECLRLIRNRPE
jgi:hypothetical protein